MITNKFWSVDKETARRKDLSSTAKLVLSVLYDYERLSNRNGRKHAHPGIRRISDDLGIPRSTVWRTIQSLEKLDLIETISGSGRASNKYVIKKQLTGKKQTEIEPRSVPYNGTQKDEKIEPKIPVVSHLETVVSHLAPRSVPPTGQTKNIITKNKTKKYIRATGLHAPEKPAPEKPPKKEPPKTKTKIEKPKIDVKARNEIWDTLNDLFSKPITKSENSLRGKTVKGYLEYKGHTEHDPTPVEIKRRKQNYVQDWPTCECTPESLLKHWQRFKTSAAHKSNPARPRNKTEYADKAAKIA